MLRARDAMDRDFQPQLPRHRRRDAVAVPRSRADARCPDLLREGVVFFTTEDAHATFAVLKERGVDVTDEPETRPYGIDFGIRDPFGNAIRIGQMFD